MFLDFPALLAMFSELQVFSGRKKQSSGSVHLDSPAPERRSGFRELERQTLQRCGRHRANSVKELQRKGKK